MLNHFTVQHHFGFEAAAFYWHFVDGMVFTARLNRFFHMFVSRKITIVIVMFNSHHFLI